MRYADELAALRKQDTGAKPANWQLSPRAVRAFILGQSEPIELDGRLVTITPKFFGDDALVERAIITLAGNRGLMLVGEPGTAKTMLSELLSAAICGISTNTVQGTAGTSEDNIKYSWNYALLLAKGPVKEALVPSPVYIGMKRGIITNRNKFTLRRDYPLPAGNTGQPDQYYERPGIEYTRTGRRRVALRLIRIQCDSNRQYPRQRD